MYPRGSNGAGQAILDAQALSEAMVCNPDESRALAAYEERRRPATARVVLASRSIPPDAILSLVQQRTGGEPFQDIGDVVAPGELQALSRRYQEAGGFDLKSLG
jgi:2-polyprenyl-6-methoxyphenol hydroxylase-like FAD-dependent oxidoreductase